MADEPDETETVEKSITFRKQTMDMLELAYRDRLTVSERVRAAVSDALDLSGQQVTSPEVHNDVVEELKEHGGCVEASVRVEINGKRDGDRDADGEE